MAKLKRMSYFETSSSFVYSLCLVCESPFFLFECISRKIAFYKWDDKKCFISYCPVLVGKATNEGKIAFVFFLDFSHPHISIAP